jgi:hypothetical protein
MPEIFVRKQRIQSGKTERLRELMEEMLAAAEADSEGVRDIWEAETLHTISLFIEHTAEADYLVWYLEAESMEQLVEARAASEHHLHELEDELLAEVIVDPEETGGFEPLAHGVSPARSTAFQFSAQSGP